MTANPADFVTNPATAAPSIPTELDAEASRILRRAHRLGLVLSREDIRYQSPDWLTIDGMDPDEWIQAVGIDTE